MGKAKGRSQVSAYDNVNHPKHYNSHPSGIECIKITEHMNFNIGNAVKYLWRADMKNGLEDLKKAAWYLAREIERQEDFVGRTHEEIEKQEGINYSRGCGTVR